MITIPTNHFNKWYNKLAENIQSVLDKWIKKLCEGNFSKCDPVGEGVHELKINFQKGYRIYFTNINGEIILLLLGGHKKRQQEDIQKAIQIKRSLRGQI